VQYESSGAEDANEHAGSPEAERRERLAQLVVRHTKLSASEAVMLREVFPEILAAHEDQVWNRLRRRGLSDDAVEDLFQEVFLALYHWLVEHGFPDNMGGILVVLTERLILNHVRAKKRAPESVALPSSGSEKPASGPDVDRVIDLREIARRLVPELPPELQEVVDVVILSELSIRDAALVLGIPEGTVKSRVMAAKRGLVALAERFLSPSERGAR
jgi:RNA polymerase sigma-70 factor (ECF subfamily)